MQSTYELSIMVSYGLVGEHVATLITHKTYNWHGIEEFEHFNLKLSIIPTNDSSVSKKERINLILTRYSNTLPLLPPHTHHLPLLLLIFHL